MEKNTLIAVILSVVVITVGFMIQNALFPPDEFGPSVTAPVEERAVPEATQSVDPLPEPVRVAGTIEPAPDHAPENVVSYTHRTDLLSVTFDPHGAMITSFELLDHRDGDRPVEMVKQGLGTKGGFTLHFGDSNAPVVDAAFHRRDTTEANTVEFYRDFLVNRDANNGEEPIRFRVRRIYRFQDGEYLVEGDTVFENLSGGAVPLNFSGIAYTIGLGPQIGPSFLELDGRNEYRQFAHYDGDRTRYENLNAGEEEVLDRRINWTAIVGKYFALAVVPGTVEYEVTFAKRDVAGLEEGAQLFLSRPVIRSQFQTDTLRYYVGPRTDYAVRYNNASDNAFAARNLELDEMVQTRFLLGWLENFLKFFLNIIYGVIPNYGIAIILLTILVKLATAPLTKKSFESMGRMQELAPKIQEIKEKHGDNPQKMNQMTAELYKKEGVNPLGGCLPMLLQFPFFIAMFGLFNNHFDLRGAVFIPGWITDLAAPESILNFGDFTLPLLGWNDLRLLPIVFVGTQLLSTKFMQTPSAQGGQMKMMTYMLPVVFFFVLYNMPSGLLVYWIFSNLLQVGQQMLTKRRKLQSA